MKYSNNEGETWNDILSFNPNDFMQIEDFEVNSFGHIFLGVNDEVYSGVFRSFDYGATQFAQTSLTSNLVDELAIDSNNKIFAATRSQYISGPDMYCNVYSSVDEGNTWINISDGLNISNTNYHLVFEIDKKDRLFLGSYTDGIEILDNRRNYWIALNSGLPTTFDVGKVIYPHIYYMSFDNDGNVYIGTSEGIFRGSKDIYVGADNKTMENPKKFYLSQNYPNPFNPSTKILYQIPHTGFVSLKVYDMLGKEVATLVNEEKPAGEYIVTFSAEGGSAYGGNGSNLSSGVYFYQLKSGSFVETKKLILMK